MSQEVKKLPKRSEVKKEETWDLEIIFATDDAWEAELVALKALIPSINEHVGQLSISDKHLHAALELSNDLLARIEKLYVYAHLKHDQDTQNNVHQSQEARAMSLYIEYAAATSFIEPEILAIEESVLQEFLQKNENLQIYQLVIDKLNKKRKHVLSADKEEMLAQMEEVANASENAFGMLNNADIKFPSIEDEFGNFVEVTHGNYIPFLESTNRQVRKAAFEALTGTYDQYKNTFASTLTGVVKKDNFFAKVRHYDDARHASLSENHIPVSVYDQLVETVNENLGLIHRYAKLRKKVLGVDELRLYDMYTPLAADSKMTVTYEESVELVKNSLKIMGEEYSQVVEEGFNKRWVDVYENVGKRSGAYSSGTYLTAPYIMMNWKDTVDNLFTLTHEFGHSVHSYLTRKYQPYIYGKYSIFVAEVASTCNEALLNHYMLERATDKNDRIYLLNHFLDGFHGTVFRQTMFAEFEQKIHELDQAGTALTADVLTELNQSLNQKYFGEELVMDKIDNVSWARIPHFYYNYYVYQYATGYAAAQSLSKQILEEGQPAVDRYINEFLKAGNSDYPIEVLKRAGVDMSSKKPIEDAMKVFETYLTQLEALVE